MNLKVLDHFPRINQSDVFLNETVKVYFNQPIDQNSIRYDNLSINDNYSFATVVGDLGPIWLSGINLSGVTSGIAFIPTLKMLPNTEYSVTVFGTPNSVLGKDGSQMVDSYQYTFVTGTGYYDSVGNIGVPSGVTVDPVDINLSGITNVEEDSITSFQVYSTNPKNQTSNISGNLSEINIVFTGNIMTSSGFLLSNITIEEKDVL